MSPFLLFIPKVDSLRLWKPPVGPLGLKEEDDQIQSKASRRGDAA